MSKEDHFLCVSVFDPLYAFFWGEESITYIIWSVEFETWGEREKLKAILKTRRSYQNERNRDFALKFILTQIFTLNLLARYERRYHVRDRRVGAQRDSIANSWRLFLRRIRRRSNGKIIIIIIISLKIPQSSTISAWVAAVFIIIRLPNATKRSLRFIWAYATLQSK